MYDWGAGDALFLFKNLKKIKDVLPMDGKFVKGVGLKCWSAYFGQTEKTAVTATLFGLLVQSDPDLMRDLRKVFGIPEIPESEKHAYAYMDHEILEARKLGLTVTQ